MYGTRARTHACAHTLTQTWAVQNITDKTEEIPVMFYITAGCVDCHNCKF